MALKYCGNTYDAEDVLQETMYRAYRNFHQLRDEAKCKPWLFAILRTTFLREQRSLKKRPLLDDGSGYLKHVVDQDRKSLGALLEEKMDKANVQQLLEMMPEKHKSPLILYYMEDMTYREIADLLDIPIGTVMSRLARAKKQMKKNLLKKLGMHKKKRNFSIISVFLPGGGL